MFLTLPICPFSAKPRLGSTSLHAFLVTNFLGDLGTKYQYMSADGATSTRIQANVLSTMRQLYKRKINVTHIDGCQIYYSKHILLSKKSHLLDKQPENTKVSNSQIIIEEMKTSIKH